MTIEVFKTNVVDRDQANRLIAKIHYRFVNSIASFDLEDCDRVLVVWPSTEMVHPSLVSDLLKEFDCKAEVLPDHLACFSS